MNVNLTPKLEELVRSKVEGGLYNSASEVVREALRLLDEQDRIRAMRHEELRKAIQLGIDQLNRGEGIAWEEVLRELKAKSESPSTAGR